MACNPKCSNDHSARSKIHVHPIHQKHCRRNTSILPIRPFLLILWSSPSSPTSRRSPNRSSPHTRLTLRRRCRSTTTTTTPSYSRELIPEVLPFWLSILFLLLNRLACSSKVVPEVLAFWFNLLLLVRFTGSGKIFPEIEFVGIRSTSSCCWFDAGGIVLVTFDEAREGVGSYS
jgi:hypothetical protein